MYCSFDDVIACVLRSVPFMIQSHSVLFIFLEIFDKQVFVKCDKILSNVLVLMSDGLSIHFQSVIVLTVIN